MTNTVPPPGSTATDTALSVVLPGPVAFAEHQPRKLIVVEHGASQQMTMNMLVTSINQLVKVNLPPAR